MRIHKSDTQMVSAMNTSECKFECMLLLNKAKKISMMEVALC